MLSGLQMWPMEKCPQWIQARKSRVCLCTADQEDKGQKVGGKVVTLSMFSSTSTALWQLFLFFTSLHAFVFAFSLLSILYHLMDQTTAITTVIFMKNRLLLGAAVCQSFVKNIQKKVSAGYRVFCISASSWRQHLKTVKLWSTSAGYPPKSFLVRPFLLLLCYLAVQTALTKYYYHVLSHFSLLDWLDWWKSLWEKTPSGWGQMMDQRRSCNKGRKL